MSYSVRFREVVDEVDGLCAVEDPVKTPFASKYKAIELMTEHQKWLASLLPEHLRGFFDNQSDTVGLPVDTESRHILYRIAVLFARIGQLHIETEDSPSGEKSIMASVPYLEASWAASHRHVSPLLNAYNQLGCLWSGRGDLVKSELFLSKAQKLYDSYCSYKAGVVDVEQANANAQGQVYLTTSSVDNSSIDLLTDSSDILIDCGDAPLELSADVVESHELDGPVLAQTSEASSTNGRNLELETVVLESTALDSTDRVQPSFNNWMANESLVGGMAAVGLSSNEPPTCPVPSTAEAQLDSSNVSIAMSAPTEHTSAEVVGFIEPPLDFPSQPAEQPAAAVRRPQVSAAEPQHMTASPGNTSEQIVKPYRLANGHSNKVEGLFTLTLFYMAQVCQKQKKINLSGRYCRATLERQLQFKEYEPGDWGTNALQLGSYFLSKVSVLSLFVFFFF
eukprot:TRINITY_DN1322_c0_g1_i4.p1 TRINITY_DN1322_c0_g1~~TRINITY_DN1322_c0_g1_i4.p1  ORF type:complete len:451 (-),score=27.46 TRINITY_DN1322_c0_g1_i4:1512-2864(-)